MKLAPPNAPGSTTPVLETKRKRLSKKGKKNWRKNVDISDVERAQEKSRHDEQMGGAVETKADADLFFVDKEPVAERPVSSRQAKKEAARQKASWDERLQVNTSKASVARNRTSSTKIRGAMDTRKEKANVVEKSDTTRGKTDAAADELWSRKEPTPDVTQIHPVPHRPVLPKRKSKVPVVEVELPGASYNPSYEAHQGLLAKAVGEEQAKVDEANRLHETLYANVEKGAKPFIHGVDDVAQKAEESDNNMDGEDEDTAGQNNLVVEVPRPKTKSERRRQKLHQEKVEASKKEKQERKRQAEVFRAKTLSKEIEGDNESREQARLRRQKIDEERNDGVLRLGRHKVKKQNIDVKLTEELVGSLRELKPEGSLIRDRFLNLQKRNIIAPRRIQPSRQKKTFEFTKKDFKASKLPFFGGDASTSESRINGDITSI